MKFFIISDNTIPLTLYKKQLDALDKSLSTSRNCCPYTEIRIQERYGYAFLIRPYFNYSLYDRISTRPFLTQIEKKWLAFQLLCALEQCQKQGVCHGDLKSENIMITSWNWLLISDFATFKPTSLPIDNPSDYSYFFDTSRRRTCFLAPERFVSPNSPSSPPQQSMAGWRDLGSDEFPGNIKLTHKMDLFSAGCVIAELFTDGQILFDLEKLLLYKKGQTSVFPEAVVSKIQDSAIQNMVRHMIQVDPNFRDTADQYLINYRDKAFPSYFYTCLKPMFDAYLENPMDSVDEIIVKLHLDISDAGNSLLDEISGEDGVLLLLPLILSCARSLRKLESKLDFMKICLILSKKTSDAVVLERVVPYLIHFVADPSYLVRSELIATLSECLRYIKTVPPSESAVFTEYVLPEIASFVSDESPLVRATLARKIGQLAQTALFFLRSNRDATTDLTSYERDELLLHASIQHTVVGLISDTNSIVRRSLLEGSVVDLCTVFGFQKTCDILLSHMVTFLNDKSDWQLRMEFYKAILAISSYIGAQVDKILKPLLIQGFADPEEFVIYRTIWCATRLTMVGLLERFTKYDLFEYVRPFLSHPNQWLRAAAIEFCSVLAAGSPFADVICYVKPKMQCYLRYNLSQYSESQVIAVALKEEIPRAVFDFLMKSQYTDAVFDILGNRRRSVSSGCSEHGGVVEKAIATIERMRSMGMKSEHELFLINLRDFFKRTKPLKNIGETTNPLKGLPQALVTTTGNFISGPNLTKPPPVRKQKMEDARRRFYANPFQVTIPSHGITGSVGTAWEARKTGNDVNTEWKEMFGDMPKSGTTSQIDPLVNSEIQDTPTTGAIEGMSVMSSVGGNQTALQPSTLIDDNSISVNSVVKGTLISGLNLSQLSETCVQNYLDSRLRKAQVDPILSGIRAKPLSSSVLQGFQFKSVLVAAVQETNGPMYRLTSLGNGYDQSFFATASDDGSIRLYDCSKMDGSQIVNQAVCRFDAVCQLEENESTHKFRHLLNYYNHMIAISTTGCAHIIRPSEKGSSVIDISNSCHSIFGKNGTDVSDYVMSAAVCSFNLNLGWVATSLGQVMLIDWRMDPSKWVVWSQQSDLRQGLFMTSCDIPDSYCFVTGSSGGVLAAWDARFRLAVKTIAHPHCHRVRTLAPDMAPSKSVFAGFQGNNEFSSWDIETGSRLKALWASTNPPLAFQSHTQNSHHYVSAVYPFPDGRQFITGSSDQRIRQWNLTSAQQCRLMVTAARDPQNIVCRYESRVIDGTEVIAEGDQGNPGASATRALPPEAVSPLMVPLGHRDIVTGITVCRSSRDNVSQMLLVSTSRDGSIKVWK